MNQPASYWVGALNTPRSCLNCRLGRLCLPDHCTFEQLARLEVAVRQQLTYNSKAAIFSQSAPFTSCYIVKSGSIKTVHVNKRGDEKVLGFYLPGEMFGLEGICSGSYECSAFALERSTLCRLNFEKLEEVSSRIPSLQHWLFQTLGKELTTAERMNRWLSYSSAEERVLGFLLDISARHRVRHLIDNQFKLAMARSDLANYLGLALETVSRILTRLQKEELIYICGRYVELLDIKKLEQRVCCEDSLPPQPVRFDEIKALQKY